MYPNLLTLSFNADGSAVNAGLHRAALDRLQTKTASDVLFVTHGWMNDTAHAPRLFAFFASALPEVTAISFPSFNSSYVSAMQVA